ncbi:hypothetical protein ERW52_05955 [Aliivibrio finisterrensis]|uniref:Uncharacterized protein n=2 Tax=Vibrionaceae TaxID=641 RepID=A0A4Q5KWJ3_9GAMM|nr:hypothetical protein ERW57_04095 [Aliivibrio finisterrensis]RYU65823.1 hypothetical protein ERW53_04615 [Aliivibrio finisterrensis]RYU86614.1 hypothetical protein ERW52_05955 [Aliivibrio finisterrensis]
MKIPVKILIDMHFHGDISSACAWFGVSRSTIYRWMQTDKLPIWALDMIRNRNCRALRGHGLRWDKWTIDEDGITTPNGRRITITQLESYSAWIESSIIIDGSACNYMMNQNNKIYFNNK